MMEQEKLNSIPEACHCNVCGKQLEIENGIFKEDVFEAAKEWGYFSNKDLEVHHFRICESCYDKMIKTFSIPVKVVNKNEVLS
ncbi:hypothetical protein EDD66_1197 [Mobilisporobacter senegalensis]|uniref:Ribosomal-protein-alanine N-acetyltransferase n=1 Tax=Mobilisporobacter senegalensis TaxID=1329262 RepID=A0A3N1X7G3_9FIRM|nr:hypothetical protein [Mobilisporobacter senegalensis]ROR21898.1 hypothetical protein EDD66_1197 [Mobilisporobacter senegalensis]